MQTVLSAVPQSTSPKWVEPVTASLPAGAEPDTPTVRVVAGWAVSISIVADAEPIVVGWNRIGTISDPPEAIRSG